MTSNRWVDFDAVPIHIHQTNFAPNTRIKSLKPGIHYGVRSCTDPQALVEFLRKGLHERVNEDRTSFAGALRGQVPEIGAIDTAFTMAEMDDLYGLGCNPLRRLGGALVVWGNRFVDLYGTPKSITEIDLSCFERRGRTHPGLFALAGRPRPIFHHSV